MGRSREKRRRFRKCMRLDTLLRFTLLYNSACANQLLEGGQPPWGVHGWPPDPLQSASGAVCRGMTIMLNISLYLTVYLQYAIMSFLQYAYILKGFLLHLPILQISNRSSPIFIGQGCPAHLLPITSITGVASHSMHVLISFCSE